MMEEESRRLTYRFQVQSWLTTAIPVDNPDCSCKLTRVRRVADRFPGRRRARPARLARVAALGGRRLPGIAIAGTGLVALLCVLPLPLLSFPLRALFSMSLLVCSTAPPATADTAEGASSFTCM